MLAHWVAHSVLYHSVTQGRPLTEACAIHPTHPVSLVAQLFCLHCSQVSYFIHKTHLLSLPDPILAMANSPNFIPAPVGTTVQIMPGLHRVIDTRQLHEYPDSTISKVLTVLKWRMITTLNRKLLEKQSVQNRFASYEVHIGHFFYNVNTTVSF